jgi:hypothetical protein
VQQCKAEEDAVDAPSGAHALAGNVEPTSLPDQGEVEVDISQPTIAATEELDSASKELLRMDTSPVRRISALPSLRLLPAQVR